MGAVSGSGGARVSDFLNYESKFKVKKKKCFIIFFFLWGGGGGGAREGRQEGTRLSEFSLQRIQI